MVYPNLKGCYGTKKANAPAYSLLHYFEIQKRGLDIIEGLVTFQIKNPDNFLSGIKFILFYKVFPVEFKKRKTGLEPATPTLARWSSTTELLPHKW